MARRSLEPALSFYTCFGSVYRTDMMGKWGLIAKNLVKSSLDHYVLPGTLTGTEILLVYLRQWKRDIFLMAAAYQRLNQPSQNELDEALVRAPESGCDAAQDSA